MLARILLLTLSLACLAPGLEACDLDALQRELRKADSTELKVEVLDAVFKWGEDAGGGEAQDALDILGEALLEEELEVRIHAATLLTGELGREQTLSHLLKGARRVAPRRKKLKRQQQDLFEELAALPDVRMDKVKGETVGESLERMQASIAESTKIAEAILPISSEVLALTSLRDAITASLLKSPSDESVVGITAMLDVEPGKDDDPLIDALLTLGSAPALDAVVGQLAAHEKRHKRRTTSINKASKELKRKKKTPRKFGGTDEEWQRLYQAQCNSRLNSLEAAQDSSSAWAETLVERIKEFSRAKSLGAPPRKPLPALKWQKWSREQASSNRAALPRSLYSSEEDRSPTAED